MGELVAHAFTFGGVFSVYSLIVEDLNYETIIGPVSTTVHNGCRVPVCLPKFLENHFSGLGARGSGLGKLIKASMRFGLSVLETLIKSGRND